jgi:hypothetical protein
MDDYFVKKAAWRYQRHQAARRNISFEMSFEAWMTWWESQLGPDWFKKRGLRKGQYVMARLGDKGPYKLGNIKCILSTDNSKEAAHHKGSANGNSKLKENMIVQLYTEDGCLAAIAAKYEVSYSALYDIRRQRAWKHLTEKLRRGTPCPCGSSGKACELGFKRLKTSTVRL